MKGISNLISAVLLIAFTLTIAGLIFGSLTGTLRGLISDQQDSQNEAAGCASAQIRISNVFVEGDPTRSTVKVIVKNIGYIDGLVIKDAQILNRSGSNFTTPSLPVENFDKGNILNLIFYNVSLSSCPEGFSQVLVTTTCGAVSDTFSGAPSCA